MWYEIGKDLLFGAVAVLLSLPGLYLIWRIIYGAGYGTTSRYGRRRPSMAASLITLFCCLLLSISVSFVVHYVSDYGLHATAAKAMQYIPSLNKPIDEPLELNLCDEWYPGCAYKGN